MLDNRTPPAVSELPLSEMVYFLRSQLQTHVAVDDVVESNQ